MLRNFPALVLLSVATFGFSLPAAAVMSWNDVEQMPLPTAGEHIAYGPLPLQFGELRVPKGAGPFPVAVLVHGGCWLSGFDRGYFTHMAAALTQMGVATWTIEYRRVGDDGGGWPGTFVDVAKAVDFLPTLARTKLLDLHRVIAIGHSSGGQLALWLAARHRLIGSSELFARSPLPLAGVIGLAPITDMETYRIGRPGSCNAVVDDLLGGTPGDVPLRYQDTSPRTMLPLGVPQRIFQGTQDPVVLMSDTEAYASAARAAGDSVVLTTIPGSGHFEPALPLKPAWIKVQTAVRELLELK